MRMVVESKLTAERRAERVRRTMAAPMVAVTVIGGTMVTARGDNPMSVTDVSRGNYSPAHVEPGTAAQAPATPMPATKMLPGDLSPIPIDVM